MTYLAPPWIRPWTDLVDKQQHLSGTMNTSSLPSFIKIHQAVLEKKLKMWKFTDDDERTDGRCAMTIAHFSLRLNTRHVFHMSVLLHFWYHHLYPLKVCITSPSPIFTFTIDYTPLPEFISLAYLSQMFFLSNPLSLPQSHLPIFMYKSRI